MGWQPRQLERIATDLDGCSEPNQAFDADNDRYIRAYVLNVPILITSARPRDSDYRPDVFAQIGFETLDGLEGQFSIGGKAAWKPLRLQRTGQLPARLVLRTQMVKRGQMYLWERA
jgi:hypothetical protein